MNTSCHWILDSGAAWYISFSVGEKKKKCIRSSLHGFRSTFSSGSLLHKLQVRIVYLVWRWILSPGGDPDPRAYPGGKPVTGGFLDAAIDRFRNEFTQNCQRDEKVEGAESPERTEFSSNRGLLSCGCVLCVCFVFGDSTSKGSDELSLWRGEVSVPRTS